MSKFKTVINQAGKSATIYLYSEIGDWECNANSMRRALNDLSGYERIDVRIHSLGGDVFEGLLMKNLLAAFPGEVHTYIDGVAASMASVIAIVGKTVSMASNGFYMMHLPWGSASGEKKDFQSYAELLDKVETVLISEYVARTGLGEGEIRAMMEKTTWLTAAEAKALGLIDNITAEVMLAANVSNSSDIKKVYNSFKEKDSQIPNLNMEIIVQALGLAANADQTKILAAITDLKNQAARLQTDLDAAKDQLKSASLQKAKDLINAAIQAGKIKETARAAWEKTATENYDMAKETLEALASPTSLRKIAEPNGKVEIPKGRETWKLDDWRKNDPQGLKAMMDNDPESFDNLVNNQ
jgi:ATP-dependent protease ClpP protease subunit